MKPTVHEHQKNNFSIVGKKTFLLLCCLTIVNLYAQPKMEKGSGTKSETIIAKTLDEWHQAAANAKFDSYFSYLTPDSHYMGTDASENWTLDEFKNFAKPYFERGKAWSFTAISRNVYQKKGADIAWFDELLDTQMGICRGSGVMVLAGGEWKIQHYVLSMTIPNGQSDKVTAMKKEIDTEVLKTTKR